MNMRVGLAGLVVLALASCSTTETKWEGGAKFDRTSPIALAELNKNAESMAGKQVQIEGTVAKVCQGRGCWVEVSDGTTTVLAKSLDEKVLFPKDCVGKKVLVQGLVTMNPSGGCNEGSDEGSGEGHECPKATMLVNIQGAQLLP